MNQSQDIEMIRKWAMPSANTFSIKPIKEEVGLFLKSGKAEGLMIDPFCRNSPFNPYMDFTNDLDADIKASHHMDALDFLKTFENDSVSYVLFDPPYSPRQVSECYKKLDCTVNMQTTQASFWSNMKKEIGRIMVNNGCVLTCGWNSGGIGKKYGFEIERILLVAHGGWHNDTIVTTERYVK